MLVWKQTHPSREHSSWEAFSGKTRVGVVSIYLKWWTVIFKLESGHNKRYNADKVKRYASAEEARKAFEQRWEEWLDNTNLTERR